MADSTPALDASDEAATEPTEPIPVSPLPEAPVVDEPMLGSLEPSNWPIVYRRLRGLAAATVIYVAAAALWWTVGAGAEAAPGPLLAFAALGVALALADLIGLFVLASAH